MAVWVFPGQGSQAKGMGDGLFEEFSELTAQADSILRYSIKTLCLEDPRDQLSQTNYTQPALFVVSALAYHQQMNETGRQPDFVVGHSLGEYNALYAAGVFDFETGLKLVNKRGELMSQASGGGMAAVIGLSADAVIDVLQTNNLEGIDIANYNSGSQIVISGLKQDIDQAQASFEKAGARLFMPLKVSGAFHSRYMQSAHEEFSKYLELFSFNAPKIPVIANTTAKPYTIDTIAENLVNQIDHSVRWNESIQTLLSQGEKNFSEIGPGRVLTGLINRIKRGQ